MDSSDSDLGGGRDSGPEEVWIVGAGALGGALGALVARSGRRPIWLRRPGSPLPRGFEVLAPSGERLWTAPDPIEDFFPETPKNLSPAAIFVCVKVYDTAAVGERLRQFSTEAPVLLFQNGIGGLEELTRSLAPERVFMALTTLAAMRLDADSPDADSLEADRSDREKGSSGGPGPRIQIRSEGRTHIAPSLGHNKDARGRASEIARRLVQWGLETENSDASVDGGARAGIWRKLLINASINALTGLLGVENGRLLESASAAALADAAARETIAVARDLGIDPGPVERWREVAERTARNRSSTLQDLTAGRRTEIAAINGAIAERAAERGLEAPVNRLLAELVAAREELARGP